MPTEVLPARLAMLQDITTRIADAEEAGDHVEATQLWEALDVLVDDLTADQLREVLKHALVAGSESRTRLVFGPRGAFARLAGRSS